MLGQRVEKLPILVNHTLAQRKLIEGHNARLWKITLDSKWQVSKVIVRGNVSRLRYELTENALPALYKQGVRFCIHAHSSEQGSGLLTFATMIKRDERLFWRKSNPRNGTTFTGWFRALYITVLAEPFLTVIFLIAVALLIAIIAQTFR